MNSFRTNSAAVMNQSSSAQSARGFSLVEVVLAIGIISFCLVALLGLLIATGQSARESKDRTENSLLFQKVLGQLKMKPFNVEQPAQSGVPEILPLPSLQLAASHVNDEKAFPPFVVDAQQQFVGMADDSSALLKGDRIVRVIVLDATHLKIRETDKPPTSTGGQLAFVRVEISSPAGGYRESLLAAPNKSIYETEVSPQEQ